VVTEHKLPLKMGPSLRRNLGFPGPHLASKKELNRPVRRRLWRQRALWTLGNLGPPRAAEGHRRRHARGIATWTICALGTTNEHKQKVCLCDHSCSYARTPGTSSRRKPMMPQRAKGPARFIQFRALPADEVTLLIL